MNPKIVITRRSRAGSHARILAACILAAAVVAHVDLARGQSRGELLYSTHCIACHTAEVHWRDKRLATDWESLKQQVRRWQANAGLGWSDDEIDDVARYLNLRHYNFPTPHRQADLLRRAKE
jgi:mono/diheme cytochrome c family protein